MDYANIAFIKLIFCEYINILLGTVKANSKWAVIKSNKKFVWI